MNATERARSKRRERLDVGDVVAPAGLHFPKGKVRERLPLSMVAVEWPDGLLTLHHRTTLRKVC